MYKKTNLSRGSLSAQLLIGGTSLVLGTNQGLMFPATGAGNIFVGVIWGAAYVSPEADDTREFVVAYRSSGDTFTITRAQEGTSAKQWEVADNFMLTSSAAVFDEYEAALGNKVDVVAGKGLSTNDYDDAAETKLAGIEAAADVTDIANVGAAIHGASADTLLDADELTFWDAVDSILKKITWANIKATLKTWILGRTYVTVGFSEACDYIVDGTADEVQIQAAIDAVTAAGGGVVKLMRGSYSVADLIRLKADVSLQGEGMEATIITTAAEHHIIYVEGNNTSAYDFKIDGGNNGVYSGILMASGTTYFTARRLRILNIGGDGIRPAAGGYIRVHDCIISACGTSDPASPSLPSCISINSSVKFWISGNDCSGTTTTATRGCGISVSSGSYGYITNNHCYSNNTGIDVPYGMNIVCSGNTCHTNTVIGIDFSNGGQQNRITDNYCYNNGIDGIRCWASDAGGANFQFNVVANNVCDSNATGGTGQGIYFSDTGSGAKCSRNTIRGNICMDRNGTPLQDRGIYSDQQSDYLLVVGNICYNNQTANLTLAGANNVSADNMTS